MTRPYKPENVTPKEWLFARVETHMEQDRCWIWPASTNGDGYGKIAVGKKLVLVHRLAFEACVGPIPPGLTLDHLCCNRACIRPSHLEPVSPSENLKRGWERRGLGRARASTTGSEVAA